MAKEPNQKCVTSVMISTSMLFAKQSNLQKLPSLATLTLAKVTSPLPRLQQSRAMMPGGGSTDPDTPNVGLKPPLVGLTLKVTLGIGP